MPYSLSRAVLWITALAVLSAFPLAMARFGPVPPPRAFWVEFGVALGFLGLALLAVQFIISGRLRWFAKEFGMDNKVQYHREMGIIAFVLILGHVVVLLAADPAYRAFFDPGVNFLRAVFLVLASVGLVVVLATSIWREAFRLQYEWWRLIHGLVSVAVLLVALAHAFQVSHFTDAAWKKAILGVFVGGSMYLVVHTRLVRPWLSRKRPYRVVDVRPERAHSWSLTLNPRGHEGMQFRPGQFAWITLRDSPFSLQQHPFSVASSARVQQLRFTAKELGDFTATWGEIEPGTQAFLEGPFGSFVPDPASGTGLFMIMGGIGITPAMGMLQTLRDDQDPRPVTLLYGNQNWEDITFREELEELSWSLDLKVVHILEKPHEGWEGEEGFVTRDLLKRYLPNEPNSFQYLICGPKPLMDISEVALRELGISWERIYTERFNIV